MLTRLTDFLKVSWFTVLICLTLSGVGYTAYQTFIQYTEGDTDSTITGTAALMEGAANALVPLQGDATNGLLVNLGSNNDVTVTGSVTVTDGSGALNVIVDSGTVSTITNPVTVTDGSGALNVICDSGCGSGQQYTEDGTTVGGESLTLAGSSRRDSPISSAGSDGDYATINTDASGRLWVNNGAIGVEDAAETAGTGLIMAGTVRRDTAASSAGTTGDNATLNTDSTGRLWVNGELPDAAALADDTANPTVPGVGSYNMCFDGTTWDRCVKSDGGAGSTTSATTRVVTAYDSGVCNPKDTSQFAISISSSGNNELVALTSSQTIYVCDLTLVSNGTVGVQVIYGTGTACATGETNMSGVLPLVANSGWSHNYDGRLKTAASNALCLELSAAVQVDGIVTYRKAATF